MASVFEVVLKCENRFIFGVNIGIGEGMTAGRKKKAVQKRTSEIREYSDDVRNRCVPVQVKITRVLGIIILMLLAIIYYMPLAVETQSTDFQHLNHINCVQIQQCWERASHSVIHINGNADLAAQAVNEGWAGNGTEADPYIIENYEIDANGGAYGIWVVNVDLYFVIRNCTVFNATDSATYPYGSGIALASTSNGTITSNNVTGNYIGIGIDASSENIVSHNEIVGNEAIGVGILTGNNNTITGNNVGNTTAGIGIALMYATNTSVTENTVFGNAYYGIYVEESSYNNLVSNSISGNAGYGIYIASTGTYTTIYNNSFNQNNGAVRGTSDGKSQGYDDGANNLWYDDVGMKGNYWSNWNGSDWGTPNAYPIDGSAGAHDMYPLGTPVTEISLPAVLLCALACSLLCWTVMRVRAMHARIRAS